MSANIFVISDTHFDHANILKFKRHDGTPLREFQDIHHMNHIIMENWNKVVTPQDTIYHVGDVAMGKNLWMMKGLNGHKRLVRGNHDKYKLKEYVAAGFEEVYGVRHLPGLWMTHVPMHPSSLGGKLNIHGHTHYQKVMGHVEEFDVEQEPFEDTRYFCVSVECINYTPISIEEIAQKTGRKLL